MTTLPDPDRLFHALDSAVDNAIHWRDLSTDPDALASWQADVDVLEGSMPLLNAAPDLLAALKDCAAKLEENGIAYDAFAKATAAIARAEAAP